MAPVKRSAENDGAGANRSKHTGDDRAAKRQRKSDVGVAGNTKPPGKEKEPKAPKAPQPSVLKQEEKAFPRGGASVLTPLEHKQIQIEATRDVLFEQSGKKAPKDNDSDREDGNAGEAVEKKSKKRRKSKGAAADKEANDGTQLKIEGLSYKRLVPGSMVLGKVTQITSRDVALALPNNITGFIPLTGISDQLITRIEKLLDEEEREDADGDASDEGDDINLQELFHVGQYLRAFVKSTEQEETESKGPKKVKKRIELSINPRETNSGISKADIVVNSFLQASVVSNEEHGLVMDLGLEDGAVKGFMSSKELGKDVKHTEVQEGAVFLCLVTGLSSDGRIVKLSADPLKAGNIKKSNFLVNAPTVDVFLPGAAVEMLVAEITSSGVAAKIMGMLDATADLIHSGAAESEKELSSKYKVGSKLKARIVCTFPDSEPRKVGVSLLPHVIGFESRTGTQNKAAADPLEALPIAAFVDAAKVTKVVPNTGLFLDVNVPGVPAFAHISRITDGKIETLSETSGAYKLDSIHRARIVGYNAMDGHYLVSLEQKVLEQPFLRIEDIKVGQIVKGKVDKLIFMKKGADGVLVTLADGITGLVPEMHLADVHLQHPDRKFKPGMPVTARVLSTNPERRQVRLTLKKSLVNSEVGIWSNYHEISPGSQAVGTLINILPSGAVVQFYGGVKAWLPVSEMSEAYIQDPAQHFRIGQVVNVHALSLEPEQERMTVSCKDPSSFGLAQQNAFKALEVGDVVKGTVTEKSGDNITVDVSGSGVKGLLRLGQLTDGSEKKDLSTMKKIRVGQTLEDLVILEKLVKKSLIVLTNKPSLLKAARAKTLVKKFEDVQEDKVVNGFVRGIDGERVFVEFAGGVVGLLFKSQLADEMVKLPDFGLRKDQSLEARVSHVDHNRQRFWLSMKTPQEAEKQEPKSQKDTASEAIINPVDGTTKSMSQFSPGAATVARITSVKESQLNVQLADNVQGRIDVSEAFKSWEDIKDKKHPLRQFKPKETIPVKVLGIHDARNHRFLPITHRGKGHQVFELTAKNDVSGESDTLTLEKITVGSSWVAFVNNVQDNCVWVNLSPNVRGRIDLMDLSDAVSKLSDIEKHFPIGSALQVRVKNVDVGNNRLDLAATSSTASQPLIWQNLKKGMVLPARITKVTERSIMVQLNENISGPIGLTELSDDYDTVESKLNTYKKNDIIPVCIADVDAPNKKLRLSTRESNVLSSTAQVKDPQINSIQQVKVNDVIRGFVKHVMDKGVFVSLSPNVTAFVRVSDLSDSYIKDWQSAFEVDQKVKGKVLVVDPELNHVQMTLKASMLDKDYVAPLNFSDMKVGQIVTGKVRKVEDFGVFIVVDNSNNVSGLCHRSEIADGQRVEDVRTLYKEGDEVKAKVLKIDQEKRRINFGLKYSYFQEDADDSDDEDMVNGGVELDESSEDEEMEDGGIDLADARSIESGEGSDVEEDEAADEMDVDEEHVLSKSVSGLKTSGFDFSGNELGFEQEKAASDNENDEDDSKKKKRRKPTIQVDRTGDMDRDGPSSVADYERLLLGEPNKSALWIQYMVFQRDLGEVEKARQIAKRALASIMPNEEQEKLNVWTALLHLENGWGSDESVEDAFKEACQRNDTRQMHERLLKIYIDSGKLDKAESLYQAMTKNKEITHDPEFWYSYAAFLMTTLSAPDRARVLLQRATQSVEKVQHRHLTSKFGSLEFKSPNGDKERGRTIFEGLLSTWPSKWDLWDMFVDLEKAHGEQENVRALYERMIKATNKKRRLQFVFKKWKEFEEKVGNAKGLERVKMLEQESAEKAQDGADA